MLKRSHAFAAFSVDDLARAKRFYGETLGLDVSESMGQVVLNIAGGSRVLVYSKPNHAAATFTVLNFPVEDVAAAVEELSRRGVRFEIYGAGPLETDGKGVHRAPGGPVIAWFKDPAGNFLSILEERRG